MDKPNKYTEMENVKEIIDFAAWYSGMDRNKVEAAYNRYLREVKKINISRPREPEAINRNEQAKEVCENLCNICGQPVGNDVFVRCDDCWDK